MTSSSLLCEERPLDDSADLDDSDDLSFDGIRSFEDPNLVRDRRVLRNVLITNEDEPKRSNYFKAGVQTEIKPHMRRIVADWMLEVTEEQRCQPEVFALAVNYLDRILASVVVGKNQMQLLVCVCMFLASKFKETVPLCADKLVVYADFSITVQEITQWELLVLEVLGWDLSAITPSCVLDQLLLRLDLDPSFDLKTIRRHAETFVSLVATEYSLASSASSSLLAIASLLAALNGMKRTVQQEAAVQRLLGALSELSGASAVEILGCMASIEETMATRMPPVQQSHAVPTSKQAAVAAAAVSNPVASPRGPSCGSNPPSASPTDLMDVSVSCVF